MVSEDKIKGQIDYAKKQRESAKTEGDWTKWNSLAKKLQRAKAGLPKPKEEEETTEEGVTDSGDVANGVKTQYGFKIVQPKYLKTKLAESVEEKCGCFEEIAFITEEKFVEYNSRTKIATLYEGCEEGAKLRVTNTDWNLYWESVVDQLGGIEE